jgi:hypothetical protein
MKILILTMGLFLALNCYASRAYVIREQSNAESFTCKDLYSGPTRTQGFKCVSDLTGEKYDEINFYTKVVLIKKK